MGSLDHIGMNVKDYARSKAFYDKALKPLGVVLQMNTETGGGYGKEGVEL